MSLKLGFVTCVQLGLDCLDELCQSGAHFSLVVTLHDQVARGKSGRVYLDQFCEARKVPLLKVRNVNEPDCVERIRSVELDWLFIIGWSQIARQEVLSAPRYGVLGIHPTLLPVGRGRAPIPWAILKGLSETGVTLFKLDEGVDSGPIVRQHRISIGRDEDASSLYQRVCQAHRTVLRDSFRELAAGTLSFSAQDERAATYWPGRSPDDGEIRPSMTVGEADRLVRATTRPYPGAFWVSDGCRIRVWRGVPLGRAPAGHGPASFRLSDGWYAATEYEVEPASSR